MEICGLNKTTLVDFDGYVASTIFTAGCNFACPFCHNKSLVEMTNLDRLSEVDVLKALKDRSAILDAVCITGGEPTLQKDLKEFILKVKELGLKVKLDTNGTHPEVIKELIDEKTIDYVAMDIKNNFEDYDTACGEKVNLDKIKQSVRFIMNGEVDYEFRTTVVGGIHTKKNIKKLAQDIVGAKKFFLQKFVKSENVLHGENLTEIPTQTMEEFLKIAQEIIPQTKLRGI